MISAKDADEARAIERELKALLDRAIRLDQRVESLQSIDAAVAIRTARDAMSVVSDQCEMAVSPPLTVLRHKDET